LPIEPATVEQAVAATGEDQTATALAEPPADFRLSGPADSVDSPSADLSVDAEASPPA